MTQDLIQYKDFVISHPDPIKAVSDDTVQQGVYNWFKYRYIGFTDQDKFLDILQRNVAINYPIYKQKLRIEPGVSQYDWLVQAYRERQLKSQGTEGNVHTRGEDLTITTGEEHVTGSTTYGGTVTDTKTGTEDRLKTGTEGTARTGSDSSVRTGGQTASKSGGQTTVKSGGHTVTDTEGKRTTTVSPHVGRVTAHGGHVSNWSGDSSVSAVNPLSKSYSNFETEGDLTADKPEDQAGYFKSRAYADMPSKLNWDTVSSQSQAGHRDYNVDKSTVEESYKYGEGVKGDITTTEGDTKNPDKHDTVYNDETDKTTYDGMIDKTTYDNVTDTKNFSDNSTTTYDTNDNLTLNTKDSVVKGGKDTNARDNNTSATESSKYGDIEDKGTHEQTDREQVTGRNEAPADILIRATAWIEQSSAFKWFKKQIEPCFAPWYNEDGGLI